MEDFPMAKVGTSCIVSLLCVAAVIAAQAQSTYFTTLANFDGADGVNPFAGLVQASDGNFYGTTYAGGASNDGTVFRVTHAGALTTIYSFCLQGGHCADGSYPWAGLIQATDGKLYGTTNGGGANGYGTVFKITLSGALTTLYSFCAQLNCTDGGGPVADLVQGADGNFYGAASGGGTYGYGTVFKITPSGTLTTLHSFDYSDGAVPEAALVQATDGNFYGTTEQGGGIYNDGTVFQITLTGALTTLHSFEGYPDGSSPFAGLVQATDGNFYGTTEQGGAYDGGTVFKITPGGTLTTLHSFNYSDGSNPSVVLVQASDGNFYGTTSAFAERGVGTIFSITPGGTLTTLHQFNGADGLYPKALVQAGDGSFYGTTEGGGAYDDGTVFRLGVLRTCATCRR
jgi:uncharacterized repeat protein (TIGR03803 family)